MATLAARPEAPATRTQPVLKRASLCAAVVVSRLVVVAAGVAGGLEARVAGWTLFDPTRISSHLGSAGNLLAATSVRWDSIHYLAIAQHGYSARTLTVFFPLYPLLIHALSWIVPSAVLSGLLISVVALAASLALLHRLTVDELGLPAAGTTVLLLAFAPLSFFFTAIYTESLFLALSLGCFCLARRGRFGLAGVIAAAAALTRLPGILLMVPLLMMYLQAHGRSHRIDLQRGADLSGIALPAVALAGFLVYLHARGYGWLAPVTNQMSGGYGHSTQGPLVSIWQGLISGLTGLASVSAGRVVEPGLASPFLRGSQNLIYLIVFAIAVTSLVGAWRRLPKAYAVYAGLMLIICISSPVPAFPFKSIDRYMLVVFPLWMAAAAWLQERRAVRPVLYLSTALLVFYCVMAARWSFIA